MPSLKVRHNNMLGYYVETTQAHADKLDRDTFIHRQTMANAMRFTTVELGELEAKISQAGDRAVALELEVFAALVEGTLAAGDRIARAATALAAIDVSSALALLCQRTQLQTPAGDHRRRRL